MAGGTGGAASEVLTDDAESMAGSAVAGCTKRIVLSIVIRCAMAVAAGNRCPCPTGCDGVDDSLLRARMAGRAGRCAACVLCHHGKGVASETIRVGADCVMLGDVILTDMTVGAVNLATALAEVDGALDIEVRAGMASGAGGGSGKMFGQNAEGMAGTAGCCRTDHVMLLYVVERCVARCAADRKSRFAVRNGFGHRRVGVGVAGSAVRTARSMLGDIALIVTLRTICRFGD